MAQSFLSKVRHTIETHGLLRKTGRVVVAVSGGADSVALLVALVRLGYDCVAAHCNFHLRGDESNRDMRFVEDLTERLSVDLYVKEFNVRERIKTSGESVEMACRSMRYQWFYDLLDRDRAQAIAVGHHREDQIETLFINLLRGTGLTGLAGMRRRAEHVVRPFLDLSRKEIEDFLREEGIEWIVDSSNLTDEYTRNKIRNHLIPLMEELFPGATGSINRTMVYLRENEALYSLLVERTGKKYLDEENGEINLKAMRDEEPFAEVILFELLKTEGFNRTQTDDMIQASMKSGGVFRSNRTHLREVDHGILRAPRADMKLGYDEIEVSLSRDIFKPVHIVVTQHSVKSFSPENSTDVIYLDSRTLEGNHQWTMRHWRRGDRFQPFGMKGTKLVSDVFTDLKLSQKEKSETWLLTRDDEIVWIVGRRASNLFTVGPGTKLYLRLELKKDAP